MSTKAGRPPTDFLERARSLVRAMQTNDIAALPDGTTHSQLEKFIVKSVDADNTIGLTSDTLKGQQDDRTELNREIWRITKGGIAHIVSKFGDDAVQLEQVGLKRRSNYAKPARTSTQQTAAATSKRKSQSAAGNSNPMQASSNEEAYLNGASA